MKKDERVIVVPQDILDDFITLISLAAVESSARYQELQEVTKNEPINEITKIMMDDYVRVMELATTLANELCNDETEQEMESVAR